MASRALDNVRAKLVSEKARGTTDQMLRLKLASVCEDDTYDVIILYSEHLVLRLTKLKCRNTLKKQPR